MKKNENSAPSVSSWPHAPSLGVNANAVAELLEKLVTIGAPTGHEARRSQFIEQWLHEQGVVQIETDDLHNIVIQFGSADSPGLLLDAHIDTVFGERELTLHKLSDDRWACPGIQDNTASCAVLMSFAAAWAKHGAPPFPVTISLTVGEEGEGNLRGIRAVMDRHAQHIAFALMLDLDLDAYARVCVGSVRTRLKWKTTGGHSWGDFSRPSATHEAASLIAEIKDLAAWRAKYLSYNVGTLHGGDGINKIAGEAEATVEIRSINASELQATQAAFEQLLEKRRKTLPDVQLEATTIGIRPASELDASHPAVAMIAAVHEAMNLPLSERPMSTNANWPGSLGIPALCTGLVHGSGIHTRAEEMQPSSLAKGIIKLDAILQRWPFV